MENIPDISLLTIEQLKKLQAQIELKIKNTSCNVATFHDSLIDACYADTKAFTVDLTAKHLADFEDLVSGDMKVKPYKLLELIVRLIQWYETHYLAQERLNLILQSDVLDNPEAEQLIKWPAQKAAELRNRQTSYPSIRIHYEHETKRLAILCNNSDINTTASFIGNLISSIKESNDTSLRISRKDIPKGYASNPYIIGTILKRRLPSYKVKIHSYINEDLFIEFERLSKEIQK